MFILRNLLLAAMALSLVMAAQDGSTAIVLKQCADQEFDETYFSFTIDIDHFSEECEDFEELSEKIQLMIEKVESVIPEYDGEEVDATVCSLPSFAGEGKGPLRRLGRRRRGKYSYAGAGGCRRCKRNQAVRRRGRYLEAGSSESFEKRVCETLVGSAALNGAVAEHAVVKAGRKLNDLEAKAVEKETVENLDRNKIDEFVNNAKEELEKCKEEAAMAKARALFFEQACKSADFAGVVTSEDAKQGFEMVANIMSKDIEHDAKDAQKDFYHVKDEGIDLQIEVVKSKFDKIETAFKAKREKKKEELDEEIEEVKEVTKKIEVEMKRAKKRKNSTLEQELEMEKKMLEEQSEALKDNFELAMEREQAEIDNNFVFALGVIEVEAANTFEDYMEAFADLMTKGLEGYLNAEANGKFSACFEKEPKVKVECSQMEDEGDKDALLADCPEEVE